MKKIDKKTIYQFVKFSFVGVSNTIISYALNVLILLIISEYYLKYDYIVANVIAFTVSIVWSFLLNSRFVFIQQEGEHRKMWTAFWKMFLVYGFTGYILNNVLSYIWISHVRLSKYIVPLINLFITVPLNFILNKYWTFESKGERKC